MRELQKYSRWLHERGDKYLDARRNSGQAPCTIRHMPMEACTACQRLASDPRSLHDRRRVVLKYQEDAPLSGRRRYASNTYVCDRCQTGWWVSRRGLRPQQGEVWTVDRRTHDRRAVDRG